MTEDVTIQGSLRISVEIDADGTFVVNNSNDHMYIGGSSGGDRLFTVTGLRSFDISNGGKLTFDRCKLLPSDPAPSEAPMTWKLSGTNSEVALAAWTIDGQGQVDWHVSLAGGVLDVDRDFSTKRGLEFSGAKIEVAADKAAEFRYE